MRSNFRTQCVVVVFPAKSNLLALIIFKQRLPMSGQFCNWTVKHFLAAREWNGNHTILWMVKVNPVTPMPAVTSLGLSSTSDVITFDQNWHHLCSTSGGEKDLSRCPDQSDWPNGAWDMHKNAEKAEWKTQSKISCHYTWLLRGKNCPSQWRFLRSFLTARKPSGRSITAAKRKEKEKKERRKKIPKIQKPKAVKILISLHARVKMS